MIPLPSIIHDIFADNIEKFISRHSPSFKTLKVLNHIVACRTPELGAALYDCVCGERSLVYHSCRDRHCPVCQNINNARWAEKQMMSSLPVKYYHIVFTLPDILYNFIRSNQRQAYGALFNAASSALLKICADPKHLGATPGFTAILHTWGQTMQFHPHLHVIITAGGLSCDGLRFIDKSKTNYLLPVKALSKLYRGIFIETLSKATDLPVSLKSKLYRSEFFCYLKEPLNQPHNAVKYLARYANRVCISDARIISYDKSENTVTFSFKDNKNGGISKNMTLSALEFMRRFLLHVLPPRFMKIRHYGILRNRDKMKRIKSCRSMLNAAAPYMPPSANHAVSLCPSCAKPISIAMHLTAVELKVLMLC